MQREYEQLEPKALSRLGTNLAFLPDYTEHPKPKRRKSNEQQQEAPELPPDDEAAEVTFFHDFVAGGVAGSASVVVGHPFDTIKVRIQTSSGSGGLMASMREFGGLSSLFRGMGAPLSAAAIINAIVFSSYGVASRVWDNNMPVPDDWQAEHDPWQKAMTCGSFAGLVQCVVICPMEHVKCRLQVQHGKGATDFKYKGPIQAVQSICREFGWPKLYQGWWATVWREVPAFGLYFCAYDYLKDKANAFFASRDDIQHSNSHTWLSSAFAGGFSGCLTWGMVYSVDVIKTKIQTMPLDTPASQLRMWNVASALVAQHGWKHLFRGLGITLVRAFPVNGTIFPVYEFTLMQVCQWEKRQQS